MTTRVESLSALTAPGQLHELIEVPGPRGPVRAFKNAQPTLGDLYASTRSELPFVVYLDERLTFEDVWRASCAFAHALVADFGIKPGDRVAISMRNFPEWMIAFNAATSVGAVAVAMNALWQPHEMEYGLSDCGARVLVCDSERLTRLSRFKLPPTSVAVVGVRLSESDEDRARALGVTHWAAAVAPYPDASEMPAAPGFGSDSDAIMLYTSGSTGAPKGAVSSHRAVISALMSWELDLHAAFETGLFPRPEPGAAQGAALLGIPLFHVTGLHAVYLQSFRLQRRVISMWKWDAATAAALVEAERITNFTAPPAVTGDLIEAGRIGDHDLSALTAVGGGGAARAPDQVRAIPKAFPNARPATGWGMTETNAIGVGIVGDDYLAHPDSSGRCSAVLDIRIVSEDGTVQGIGERGELQIRGVSMCRGYWNRPDADAEAFLPGGWFRTGDVAYLDAEGFCFIVDRIKDLVIRGGENIGCGAVEAALLEHPSVIEACVYGVPDRRLGEEVAATVYATNALSADDLRAFVTPRLARFEVPRYIEVMAEPLPRIATGKLFKRQLRAEHTARLVP